ncbi:MAG: tetratricopeptide repeat protein [Vicinamibacteria bacterium]
MTGGPALESARTLAALGRGREARATLDAILERDPGHPAALVLLGEVLLHDRDAQAALAAASRAAAADEGSAEARNLEARALHALGRDEEALASARKAQSLLSGPGGFRQVAPVYLTLVWCLRALGRLAEALETAEEGLRRTPDAVLAEWAGVVEQDLAAAQEERC